MNKRGCIHLRDYKSESSTDSYRLICQCMISCISKDSRKIKATVCVCAECNTTNRVYACLYCVHFACRPDHLNNHVIKKNHYLAADINFGFIYCFKCKDYVYEQEFDDILFNHKRLAAETLEIPYVREWEPDEEELFLLKCNPVRVIIGPESVVGLRGLVNLGNTCFMNCILQVLMHTPLMRDYFLSDKHRCLKEEESSACLVCLMIEMCRKFYSGNPQPLMPHEVLKLVWTHANHLLSYGQQDAHEFLNAVLDILHQHSTGKKDVFCSNTEQCDCFIHCMFTGILKSDVQCMTCKETSTKFDPFWDISLDLGTGGPWRTRVEGTPSPQCYSEPPPTGSLTKCLSRFTQLESLGEAAVCYKCNSAQRSTKQLSVHQLPPLIVFHMKRSESTAALSIAKNESFVSFPETLDMTPFISKHFLRKNEKQRHNCFEREPNIYQLYAVVNHRGSGDIGHYTSYVRYFNTRWYKCDDHKIDPVSFEEVLKSECYLLFYHKKILEFQP